MFDNCIGTHIKMKSEILSALEKEINDFFLNIFDYTYIFVLVIKFDFIFVFGNVAITSIKIIKKWTLHVLSFGYKNQFILSILLF